MKKIVVTVIGADRVGIVAAVSAALAKENINILDISQTIVDDIFDMVLMCDMENATGSLKELQDNLGEIGKAAYSVQELDRKSNSKGGKQ